MKKLTQLHVDVSAYLSAVILTMILCFFAAAICYVEMCANETLLSSGGALYQFFSRIIDFFESNC
ncbi:MAG: hypothetical protein II126_02940 [Erysipelotrichaceae bacterium]|nr:hypothetical protein [Erysipelotrichaceae bacterium]